ncbi:MAG: hypothetical protein K8I00_02415, partial [Candidatus Omnitrophica bacterium]|nr:hypothetical protein [Candidatus Omnitrophota bacterium]
VKAVEAVAPVIKQELVGEQTAPQDEETVTAVEAEDEAVSEKKSFLAGLTSMFKRKNKASTEDAPVSGEVNVVETAAMEPAAANVRKYQAMRKILNDKDLDQISSQARKPAGVEQEIVYTEEPEVKKSAGVAEDLPKEIKLVKVSPQPLETLPNPVVLEEASSDEKADVVMMNQGVIYQEDVPERAPEDKKVKEAKTNPKKIVKSAEAESVNKMGKVADGSVEEGFMALRANMQEAEAVVPEDVAAVKREGSVDEPVEEDLMTKFRRKISPSGMLKEEVAELDYWDVPVEAQTIDDISRNLKIEQAMKEAANITLQEEPSPSIKERYNQQKTMVVSPEEIVRQAIPSKNRDKRIDLDFDNTNLSDILLIMGEAGEMNILLDPALKSNTLDLHLKQISLEDALLLIANSYDLGFKLVGQALFITEKDKLKFENKVSRIIKVRNVNVQEAKQLVEDLADKVNISEELNSLIVIGDPQDVAQVENLVAMIDNPQPQVILEAKIIEVNKDALRDLGVDWSDQINVLYQESGRPQEFDDIENSTGGIYRIAQIQRNALQFEATIRMLEQQNKAKVLSAPRVSTLNGKEAEIFVGDEVPYTITNITGGVVTNDVRFVEPGIRLKITPSIIEDDFVVMKVEPEVSFIVAFRGPNDEFPQVRTREATAHVRVENKQPFVLGGILNQEDKQSLFKVPFFGNLPLFGNLFSYEKNTAVDTELIITVIPTIVHGRE